jgi:DNA excision repair protein ERCC-8
MITTTTSRRRRPYSSIFSMVLNRQHGILYSSNAFGHQVSQKFSTGKFHLQKDPEIISPHRSGISSLSSSSERFLLAGSSDGTVSIYDITKWGCEEYIRQESNNGTLARRNAYHPIARSIKVTSLSQRNALEIPAGHSSSITHVQWYPVDTGAFLTSASDGTILFWDTNAMEPVLRVTPFSSSISTTQTGGVVAHLQTGGDHSLVAAGGWNLPTIKLVDLRSGASSHELSGHALGLSCVKWSPTHPTVLASGSRDGSIRLWDIRKSGSRACLAILDRDSYPSSHGIQHYQADYAHLRTKNRKRQRELAPNYYHHLEQSVGGSCSHTGPVTGLEFSPSGHSLASTGGIKGELLAWDLRTASIKELRFIAPGGREACTPRQRSAAIQYCGKDKLWVGYNHMLLQFDMEEEGGPPKQLLRGHLATVNCITLHGTTTLLSGSKDGMILSWGIMTNGSDDRIPSLKEDHDNW